MGGGARYSVLHLLLSGRVRCHRMCCLPRKTQELGQCGGCETPEHAATLLTSHDTPCHLHLLPQWEMRQVPQMKMKGLGLGPSAVVAPANPLSLPGSRGEVTMTMHLGESSMTCHGNVPSRLILEIITRIPLITPCTSNTNPVQHPAGYPLQHFLSLASHLPTSLNTKG